MRCWFCSDGFSLFYFTDSFDYPLFTLILVPCVCQFLVSVSKENSSTAEVLESISRSVRIKAENLRLAEVVKSRFHRIFLPSNSLDTVSSSDMLFCFEVLSKELAKERVVVLRVQQVNGSFNSLAFLF